LPERRAFQCRRLRQASVSANELFPISGERARCIVDIQEHDAIGEFGVVIVAGQQRAGLEVHFGLHMQQAILPQVAQHPFPVAGDRYAARPPRGVAQFQDRKLHRRVHSHIDPQLGGDAVLSVFKNGVAEAMPDDIGRRTARGQWRRRPELAGLLITDIEGLAGGVPNEIIVPGCQSEFVGIFEPGICAAAFRDDRPKRRIGQDIHPRGRSRLAGLEGDDIFAAVGGKPAQAVGEDQVPRGDRLG
jgi:hypothetical protein